VCSRVWLCIFMLPKFWFYKKKKSKFKKFDFNYLKKEMVAEGGIEPPTQGFSVLCSTTELPATSNNETKRESAN
jgi:hypothetical protein